MLKSITALCFLAVGALSVQAQYSGTVFVDKNGNNTFDKGEKTLAGVCVTDGLNVVETDSHGRFTLPGHQRARFITVTTPSGYKAVDKYYIPVSPSAASYDFALTPWQKAGKNGENSFIHITDTEIFNTKDHDRWANNLRDYAAASGTAFIIHTGDICYENGLKNHIKLMNSKNMGVPMYYCIGNHDLVKGKYGEELFESIYGPVMYSFNVGRTHYVVTPMAGGDHAPSYKNADVIAWLKNDLAHVKPGTSVVVFNHDLPYMDEEFVMKGADGSSIDFNDYNVKAWVYGHWHNNTVKKQGKIKSICSSTVDKGGIDHSTNSFRVISLDRNGNVETQQRYTYLDKHIAIASPDSIVIGNVIPLTVNTYTSQAPTKTVSCTLLADGKPVGKSLNLKPATDWTWTGSMTVPEKLRGQKLTVKAEAAFANGTKASAERTFLTAADAAPRLQWTANTGSNIHMTSPVISGGKVFIATVDEDLKGKAHVDAFSLADGSLIWSYPAANSIKNTIAVEGNTLMAQDTEGNLMAIDTESGKLRWSKKLDVKVLPAIIEGLAIKDGVVYAGNRNALSAYDIKDGRQLWKNKDWGGGEGTTSTLLIGDGRVYAGAQWNALYCNDAKTGKKLWSASDNGIRHRGATPLLRDGLLYFPSSESFFILDAANGRTIVRKPLNKNVDCTSTPLFAAGNIIFGTAMEGLLALDAETLEPKWTNPLSTALIYTAPYTRYPGAQVETSPVLHDGKVYLAASDGKLYCIDPKDGRTIWSYSAGAPFLNTPAIADGSIVAADFGGNLYKFSLD
ncbi:MAG: PQQ-binding-like beta-propeller repeat protein [Muribaculaceae bacterium]|nr:PQQ-binding-like beta-propeller repeat protein [Muribaculaceae bacterium]